MSLFLLRFGRVLGWERQDGRLFGLSLSDLPCAHGSQVGEEGGGTRVTQVVPVPVLCSFPVFFPKVTVGARCFFCYNILCCVGRLFKELTHGIGMKSRDLPV